MTTVDSSRPRWIIMLAAIVVVGMAVSVANELANVSINTPGWATLSRPIHALLGLGAIFWAVGGFGPGKYLLIGWIVTAIPVLGFDWSKELVDTIVSIGFTNTRESTTSFGHNAPIIGRYASRGINVAPLLVALLFACCAWKRALPLSTGARERIGPRRFDAICGTILALPLIVGGGVYGYLRSAPYLIWATEPGMSFFHEQDRLGGRYVRVTASLMDRLGLDGSIPSDQWEIEMSPWARAIWISDGNDKAYIYVSSSDEGADLVPIDTPWGQRCAVSTGSATPQRGRLLWVRPHHNPRFDVRPGPLRHTVTAGEPFAVSLRIKARGALPTFDQMRVHGEFLVIDAADGDDPSRTAEERTTTAPPVFLKLNDRSPIQGSVTVNAPRQSGLYHLMTPVWFYDEAGDYAEPIRSAGYSRFILVEVAPQE